MYSPKSSQKQTGPNAIGPDNDSAQMLDRCASSCNQMPDDRDHGKDQKQMDQTARDVESRESQNPKHEQNDTDKQKHFCTPKAKFQ
jgi:hypothetical protein